MKPDELYLKGIYFFTGDMVPALSPKSGKEYLRRAADAGHIRAEQILATNNPSLYAVMDAVRFGSKKGYKLLKRQMEDGTIHRDIPLQDIPDFQQAIDSFTEQPLLVTITADDMYEYALRYIVGDMTKRESPVSGADLMRKAANAGSSKALNYLSLPYDLQIERSYIEAAVVYGSLKSINYITLLHKKGLLKTRDSDLIEFAKAVVRLGDIF